MNEFFSHTRIGIDIEDKGKITVFSYASIEEDDVPFHSEETVGTSLIGSLAIIDDEIIL